MCLFSNIHATIMWLWEATPSQAIELCSYTLSSDLLSHHNCYKAHTSLAEYTYSNIQIK